MNENLESVFCSPSKIKNYMAENGVAFNKRLGQNFLINPEMVNRIVNLADVQGFGVLEVGAGLGVLTNALVKVAKKVVAVEIDKGLCAVLQKCSQKVDNLTVLHNDILKLEFARLISDHFCNLPVKVCSNLPYYITSSFVAAMLESKLDCLHSAVLMVQKEAAVRLCAKPGSGACGAVSYLVSYYCDPEILFNVSKGNFFPVPKVDSCVVCLKFKKQKSLLVSNERGFFRFVRVAFSQRRKFLVSPIASVYNINKDLLKRVLQSLQINLNVRAQQLSLEQFACLYEALQNEVNLDENY